MEMPNKYNFGFDFEYLIYMMPIIYLIVWPMNYMYMFNQRAHYYDELRKTNNIHSDAKKNKWIEIN